MPLLRSLRALPLGAALLLAATSPAVLLMPSTSASAATTTDVVQTGDGWVSAGAMSAYRNSASLAPLPSGKALVSGGHPSLRTTEVFSPGSGSWFAGPALLRGRQQHASVVLADGKVLITGGVGRDAADNPVDLSSSEVYDPSNNTIAPAPAMRYTRRGHTLVLLQDGRVLAVGAPQTNLVPPELFDPATGVWTAVPSQTGRLRSYPALALLRDGRVLAAGGDHVTGNAAPMGTAEVFDPASGRWTAVTSMVQQRADGHTATTLPDGRVLVVGGNLYQQGLTATAELFDPASGRWSTVAPMGSVRTSHMAAALPDGRVLVAGGTDGSQRLVSAELYDPPAQAWAAAPPMDQHRGGDHSRSTVLRDGSVLVAGGFGNGTSQRFVPKPSAAAPGLYVPVDPRRVLSGQSVGAGGWHRLVLTQVPVGASAAVLNLAAAGVTSNTYVTACPGDLSVASCRQQANLNTDRRDRSNAVIVALGGDPSSTTRSVLLYNNAGSAFLYADLQGYYVSATTSSTSGGSSYTPQQPARVLSAQPVGPGAAHTLWLDDVPPGATAVTFNLAAAGVTRNTYVTACPGDSAVDVCKAQASLNAVPGADTANLVTVKLGDDARSSRRSVLLYNNAGSVLLYADLQGFHAPGGSGYRPVPPTRVMDARRLDDADSSLLTLTGVPVGATAVAFNLAAAAVTGNTYVSACPGDVTASTCRQKANLLAQPGADGSVLVVVKLGGDPSSSTRTVLLYNNVGSVQLYADLQGYFV